MGGQRLPRSWRFLLILFPVAWLTGAALARLPGVAGSVLVAPADHEGLGILLFLLGWVVSAAIIGLILAGIARALGAETIRTLVSERQAWRFGALSTAAFWTALVGLNWAAYNENEIARYIWQAITGVTANFFGLVWLVIGVRAASSIETMRNAVTLCCGAACSFLGGIGLGVLVVVFMGGMQPGMLLFAIVSFLLVTVLILPPALLTAGMAALFAGLPQTMGRRRDEPPGMPPV